MAKPFRNVCHFRVSHRLVYTVLCNTVYRTLCVKLSVFGSARDAARLPLDACCCIPKWQAVNTSSSVNDDKFASQPDSSLSLSHSTHKLFPSVLVFWSYIYILFHSPFYIYICSQPLISLSLYIYIYITHI